MIVTHCDTCSRAYRWFGRPWWAYVCGYCGGAILHPCENPARRDEFANAAREADRFNATGVAS